MRNTLRIAAVVFFCLVASGLAARHKRVLYIDSYHPGFPTFFRQLEGIRQGLAGVDYKLDIEFIDSKRLGTGANVDSFHRRLHGKLSQIKRYDLILAGHDNALRYLLGRGRSLWEPQRIPVVFFGVNNRELALGQQANPLVTGVVEELSLLETVRLAKALQPSLKNLYFIVDATPSAQADLETLQRRRPELDDYSVHLLDLRRLTFARLGRRIRKIHGMSNALFMLAAYTDKSGKRIDFDNSLHLIVSNRRVPVYHFWAHDSGSGLVGGCLVSLYRQALTAAQMGRRILSGVPCSAIGVVKQSPNINQVDYRQLKKFHLLSENLPPGTTVLNKPVSFFSRHRPVLITAGVIIIFLLGIIIGLLLNLFHRRRLQLRLQHKNHLIRESLREKDLLLKEVHHRVKNNMQIVSSLLSLQAGNSSDPVVQNQLEESRRRIQAMALAHENLYQKKRFDRINFEQYARSLVQEYRSLATRAQQQVAFILTVEKPEIDIGQAIPCGLILNELLSNLVQHGYRPGSRGEVSIRFTVTAGSRQLEVADDGCGFPEGVLSGEQSTLGLELVRALTRQLHGELQLANNNGAQVLVIFPGQA